MPVLRETRRQAALAAAVLMTLFCAGRPSIAQPPTGSQAAAAIHGDPLPAGAVARFGTVRFRHGTAVSSLSVSPDGKLVVSSGGGHVCAWDIPSGKLVPLFPEPMPSLGCVFSADGKVLLVREIGRVSLWDVRRRKKLASLPRHHPCDWDVALSPDGKTLAVAEALGGGGAARVRLRDVATGKVVRSLGDHPSEMGRLAFTPDGRALVSANANGSGWGDPEAPCWVKRWDVATGRLREQRAIRRAHVDLLVISRDGGTVAFAPSAGDKALHVWDGQAVRRMGPPVAHARSLALTPDGRRLALHDGARILVWDAKTGRLLSRADTPASEGLTPLALAFTPDGKVLFSAGRRGVLRRWDVARGEELGEPSSVVHQVAFSPGGKLLASAGTGGTLRLWEWRSGRVVHHLAGGIGWPTPCFTPDGRTLITDDSILWDLRDGRRVGRLLPAEPEGYCALGCPTLSPDGKLLAGHIPGSEISLVDLTTRKELRRFGQPVGPGGPLAFSPNGSLLACSKRPTGGISEREHATLLLWEVATGRLLNAGSGPNSRIRSPTFSPDGKRVFGVVNRQASMWEVKGTGPRARIHPESVEDLAMLPEGTTLVLALSLRDVAVLWDLRTSKTLATLRGHRGHVHRVAVSPDGRLVATAGNDGTVLVWDVRTLRRRGPNR
jgi:WD40 repeat protein